MMRICAIRVMSGFIYFSVCFDSNRTDVQAMKPVHGANTNFPSIYVV